MGGKSPFYGLRARFFTKRRGTILESGRKWQDKGDIGICHPGFWAFLGHSVGRMAVLGQLLTKSFLSKWAKMGAKRGVFCVF
jgi:hypothetical protein